jgi:hypothetical protein
MKSTILPLFRSNFGTEYRYSSLRVTGSMACLLLERVVA